MKSESKKVFAVLIVLNLCALVLIGMAITFIYSNYNNSLNFRRQTMDEIAKVSDLTSLKQVVEDTSDERKYIESLFVDKEKVIDFLGFIESIGKLSGADVKVVSVDEGGADNPTNYTSIRFEAVGTWAEVFRTVSLIDHVSAAFSVTDLQISKNRTVEVDKKTVLQWSAIVNIRVLKLHI